MSEGRQKRSDRSNRKGTTKKRPQQTVNGKKVRSKKPHMIIRAIGVLFKMMLAIFLICLFAGVLLLGYAFVTTSEVTDNNFWISKSTTKIYDRDNNLLQIHGNNIKYVTLDEISPYYIDGLIATEDSNFSKHTGVDFKGMVRATGQTLFTDSDSGGSTITMQLAKNLYLQGTPSLDENGNTMYDENGYQYYDFPYANKIDYKLKQMVYAWKIESKYSKNEILENYVNSIGFNGPIGIERASEYYFGVEAKNLNLSQSATLAGMTQLPAAYNPYTHIEAATERRNIVLERMLVEGKITETECEQAKSEKIEDTLIDHTDDVIDEEYAIISPYLDEINAELRDEFGEDFDINQADATIYTSLDYELQEETYHIINNDYGTVGYEAANSEVQAGSATIDTQSGEILAIGGGRQGIDIGSEQNYGAFYLRQPGSTSKPIVDYGPAIEYLGWSTYHQMQDKPVNYTNGPEVQNAYQYYYGQMSIQEALSRSTNTVALQTFQAVAQYYGTTEPISTFMANLGIDDCEDINEAYSIGGWSEGTTPLEMAGAYAAFGNGGEFNEPHAIRSVEFSTTSPYYQEYGATWEPNSKTQTAMSSATAYMITKMLDPTLATAITSPMYNASLGEQGVKTGTSNWPENNYGIPEGLPRDKWVVGYNGDVTTAIWTGYSGEYESQGYYFDSYGEWSYDIYNEIMKATVNIDKEYLHDDDIVADSSVSKKTINGVTYYFKKGTAEYNEQEALDKEVEEKEKEEEKEDSSDGRQGVEFAPGGDTDEDSSSSNDFDSTNNSSDSGSSSSSDSSDDSGDSSGTKQPVEI